MTTLAQLKEKAETMEAAARVARKEYNEALTEAAPYHVGDVVLSRRSMNGGSQWQEALITRAEVVWSGIRYRGKWKLKGGDWAKNDVELWQVRPLGWEDDVVRGESRTITEYML